MPESDPPREPRRPRISSGLPYAASAVALTLVAGAGCSQSRGGVEPLPHLPGAPLTSTPLAAAAPESAAAGLPGAVRVVRRYYAALDGLRREMRIGPLTRLLAPDCPCRAQIRAVAAAIRRRWHYTDRIRIFTLVPHLDRPDLADVFVALDVIRGGLVDATGRRVRPSATVHDLHREVMLRRTADHWLIEQVIAV